MSDGYMTYSCAATDAARAEQLRERSECPQQDANVETTRGDRATFEADLIRRICDGAKELYYELIRPYERSVYLTALSVVRNPADAEDVAQEAFLKAFRALPGFRGEARFSTWLDRIAINEARMRLRRAQIERSEPLEEGDPETGEYCRHVFSDWRDIPSEALEKKEVRQLLVDALMRLPEMYREVVTLRDIEHRSIAETADLLGLTPSAVKTRLLRARLKLRDLVAPLLRTSALTSRNLFQKGRKLW